MISNCDDFTDGKQVYVHYLKDDTNSHSHIIENTKIKDKWKQQEESLKMEENVAESGRIFVRNLPYTTTEDELQRVFENFGNIRFSISQKTNKIIINNRIFLLIFFLNVDYYNFKRKQSL